MHLQARQADGAPLRTHLQRLAANTGKVDERLLIDRVHPGPAGVLDAYLSLGATRRSGMGMHAFTLSDIEAWCRLNGVRLTPWELDTLIALDQAALAVATAQQAERAKPN